MSAPRTPDSQISIRFPVPVAPGSDTSAVAGEELDRAGKARKERRRVLLYFAAQSEPRTRHELAEALYPQTGGIGSACGRVADLMVLGQLPVGDPVGDWTAVVILTCLTCPKCRHAFD